MVLIAQIIIESHKKLQHKTSTDPPPVSGKLDVFKQKQKNKSWNKFAQIQIMDSMVKYY